MDYKALYGLVFAPIFLVLIYMGYLGYSKDKDYTIGEKNITNNEDMILDNENFEQIDSLDFKKEIDSGDTVIIDVRTKEEQEKYGTISDDQLHIVYGTDNFQEELLKLDKEKKYLIYCWHGVRSAATRDFLQQNEFSWAKDLQGGIDDWKY